MIKKLLSCIRKRKNSQQDVNEDKVRLCPINTVTGGGEYVGQCLYKLEGMRCRVHGDVSKAVAHYEQTGELTKEKLSKRS